MSVSFLFVLLLQTKDTRAYALVSRRQRGGAYVELGLIRSIVMQYGSTKTTKITLREDDPVGGSSTQYRANLDAVGFNLTFIAQHDPRLAIEVIKLWREARDLREASQLPSGEAYALADAELRQLLGEPDDRGIYAK
jgi:hypothetical protein